MLLILSLGGVGRAVAAPVVGTDVIYTTSADFARGTLVNLNSERVPDQLQLNDEARPFPVINVALSARGTIARIDTQTGAILGEYRTAPVDQGTNPSRTTVTFDGSVWAGNRNGGAIVHVGNVGANQCVDRNGNGSIDTSTGYGDVKDWPNTGGVDTDGGVETAEDECILHYTRTSATATRHVSVAPDGNLWVSGRFGSNDAVFNLVNGQTGAIMRTEGPFSCGGYGGLVDRNGVVWSASSSGALLRWDPAQPTGADNPTCINIPNYGVGLDRFGNLWITMLSGGQIRKLAPDGTVLGTFPHGSSSAQGVTTDGKGDVWVTSSLFGGTTVGHLLNDGTFVGNVTGTGNGSTGAAVDAAGRVWTANINSSNATRIDPDQGPMGAGGRQIGAVDLTVPFPAGPPPFPTGSPYNYSDMTGNVLLGATAPQGTWTAIQDGGAAGHAWGTVDVVTGEPLSRARGQSRAAAVPGGTLMIEVRSADTLAALGSARFAEVQDGVAFQAAGRFLETRVTLKPDAADRTPTITDIRICDARGCTVVVAGAAPSVSIEASRRTCSSRRAFKIRIRVPRGERLRSVTTLVNGRRVAVRRGRRFTVSVDLRGLPRGRYTVEIRAKTSSGRTLTGKRRYRTCTRKLPGGQPRL